MPLYRVLARVVQVDHYIVQAEDEKKAIEFVYAHAGELDLEYSEYSHDLPVETWTVELEKSCKKCGTDLDEMGSCKDITCPHHLGRKTK